MKRNLLLTVLLILGVLSTFGLGSVTNVSAAPNSAGAVRVVSICTTPVVGLTSKTWDYNWVTTASREPYEYADLFVTLDLPTVANTTTLTYSVSPDGTTYYTPILTGATLIAARTTDTTYVTRLATFGRYIRITSTMANTGTITPTIKMVLR